jgi:hypothetical protein
MDIFNGLNEQFDFNPVKDLKDCKGWDGYIDPYGNFYKTKPRGATFYMGSANLHAEFADAYLEHTKEKYKDDGKDYLVYNLKWISYGFLILTGNECYVMTPHNKKDITKAQKDKLFSLFQLNGDDMQLYFDSVEDLTDDDISLIVEQVNKNIAENPELQEALDEVEKEKIAAEEEKVRKAKELEEARRKAKEEHDRMMKEWEAENERRRQQAIEEEEEKLKKREEENAVRNERIDEIIKQAYEKPAVISERRLFSDCIEYLREYSDEYDGFFNHMTHYDSLPFFIGDPDGEPYVVRVEGDHYIPLNALIYAKDADAAKNAIVRLIDIARRKIKKEKEYCKKNNVLNSYSEPWGLTEDRVNHIGEELLNIKVCKFDKRFVVKTPWADNDSFF